MQELSQENKEQAKKSVIAALVNACKWNNIDFFSIPESHRKAMFDCFVEGTKFVRDMISEKSDENF